VLRRVTPAIVSLAALVAGCGGGDDGGLSTSEVRERVQAICDRGTGQARGYARRHPVPKTPKAVADELAEDLRIARGALRDLRELDPSDDARDELERFVDAEDKIVESNRASVEAARKGRESDFARSSRGLLNNTRHAREVSEDAELRPDCPILPVSVTR
jgi:hypothetical protein